MALVPYSRALVDPEVERFYNQTVAAMEAGLLDGPVPGLNRLEGRRPPLVVSRVDDGLDRQLADLLADANADLVEFNQDAQRRLGKRRRGDQDDHINPLEWMSDAAPVVNPFAGIGSFSAPVVPMIMDHNNNNPGMYGLYDNLRSQLGVGKGQKYKQLRLLRALGRSGGKQYQLNFPDGSSGFGAYRRRRRYASAYSRRRYSRRRYGRGGYFDWLSGIKNRASGWLQNNASWVDPIGRAVGNAIMPVAGGHVYDFARNMGRRAGFGAYTGVPAGGDDNQSSVQVMDQDVPIISNPGGSDGPVCVRHREYICDVNTAGSAFAIVQALSINPGLAQTFPWLSTMANSFTQYRFEGLTFYFKSTSGSLSTTQALGEIIMAVNYNTVDAAFTNKQQMLNEVFAVSKVPAFDAECPVETDPKQSTLTGLQYVRDGNLPSSGSSQDLRFYDMGKFYLATQGQASAVTLGELWVSYQVCLYKPQLPIVVPGGDIAAAHFSASNYTNSLPFGTNANVLFDNIGLSTLTSGTLITFPAEISTSVSPYYEIQVTWVGTAAAIFIPLITFGGCLTSTGAPALYRTSVGNTFLRTPENGVTVSNCSLRQTFVLLEQSQTAGTITISAAGTLPSAGLAVDVYIRRLSPNVA